MISQDRDIPIVTELGSFQPKEIREASSSANDHLGRGIQFGVGMTKNPISYFEGWQTLLRPQENSGNKKPRISVDQLIQNIEQNAQRINRVTVQGGAFTDTNALRDVVNGIRETLLETEIVVSSEDPTFLRKVQAMDLGTDNVQQPFHGWNQK